MNLSAVVDPLPIGRSAVIPAAVALELGGKPRALALFVHFARYANRNGLAWPSLDRTLRDLGWSESTYYRAARALEESGHAYRVAGGHRGMVARWLIPAFRQSRDAGLDRVRAARHLYRRAASRLQFALGASLPNYALQRLSPADGGTTLRDYLGPEGLPSVSGSHPYADDGIGLCAGCGLPKGNARHW